MLPFLPYRPALDHQYNHVAATEIELSRLREEYQAAQWQLKLARTHRETYLRQAGLPSTGPLDPEPNWSLPPELSLLNQAIANHEQALAELRRAIGAQEARVAAARQALAHSAGKAAGPAYRDTDTASATLPA